MFTQRFSTATRRLIFNIRSNLNPSKGWSGFAGKWLRPVAYADFHKSGVEWVELL